MSGGGFVMVPDWLRAMKPSGNALLAYINLGSFGTFKPGPGIYDECRPSMGRLVKEMGVSESTVKRALAELVEIGAAVRIERANRDGSSAPSMYRLIFGRVVKEEGGPRVDPCPSTGGPPGGSPVDPNQEPSTQNHSTYNSSSSAGASSSSSAQARDDDERAEDAKQPNRERHGSGSRSRTRPHAGPGGAPPRSTPSLNDSAGRPPTQQ